MADVGGCGRKGSSWGPYSGTLFGFFFPAPPATDIVTSTQSQSTDWLVRNVNLDCSRQP
eukprot:m.66071 g.66071  ORF g.66071 m.66071 type:complete len:59 (-) comp8335_c0_seq2:164-340(-)